MATRKTTASNAPAPDQGNRKAASPVPGPVAAPKASPGVTAKAPKAARAATAPTPIVAKPDAAKAPRPAAKAASQPTQNTTAPGAGVTPEQRLNYIEVAAYYIAERRGFTPGDPMADWLAAQVEIDQAIASGRLGRR